MIPPARNDPTIRASRRTRRGAVLGWMGEDNASAATQTSSAGADSTRRTPSLNACATPESYIMRSFEESSMAARKGPIKVLHYGLGPIGAAVVRQVAERRGFKIVGAVDIDPAKIGRDLGEIAGAGR